MVLVDGKECKQQIKCEGGSTSGCWTHLESVHEIKKKTKKVQQTLDSLSAPFSSICDFQVEKYIASTGKAPNEVDSPAFRELVGTLSRGSYTPKSSITVSNHLNQHFTNIEESLSGVIPEEGKKMFGLQFDEYTAQEQHLEFLGITISCIIEGEFRLFKAGVHKISKADAITISEKLKDVLSKSK